jgi:hypothetical protein
MPRDITKICRNTGIPRNVPAGIGVCADKNLLTCPSGPIIVMMASSRTSAGKASSMSMARWMMLSTHLPK